MFRSNETPATKRIRRVFRRLFTTQPYFANLALHLDPVESDETKTVACDGETLFYNADFVNDTDADKITAAIARLVLAGIVNASHSTRRQNVQPLAASVADGHAPIFASRRASLTSRAESTTASSVSTRRCQKTLKKKTRTATQTPTARARSWICRVVEATGATAKAKETVVARR